jgi:hypothetical protein
MFRFNYDSNGHDRMLNIGFTFANDASIRVPSTANPAFSFPLPTVLVHLLAGIPQEQCLSDVREHMLGCLLSRHILRLDTSTCTLATRSFIADYISLLRTLPPIGRPTLLRMARNYPAFGIPADFEPEFPRVLCGPSIPAVNLSLGSADGISLLSNPDSFARIVSLLNAHPTVRTAHFEPRTLLHSCVRAAVLEFNNVVASNPLDLAEWPVWYDNLGLFRP